jgi:hippurate hydrolase
MTKAPTLQPFQLLPHLLPPVDIDAETFVNIRRQIHAQPELGFEVGATSTLVTHLLQSWGYDVHTGIGKSGVVGQLKLGNGTRRLGIRADMDALPIVEATGLPYASRNHGKMHACGHDGHTAILLAAAKALADSRSFDGTLNLIFQPDEENLCGARAMIEDGLFERFPATRFLRSTICRACRRVVSVCCQGRSACLPTWPTSPSRAWAGMGDAAPRA